MSTGPNAASSGADAARPPDEPVQIGILTEGKATLAMVIVGLVLQESVPLDIYIVDTAESAVIKRDDVVFAMRLASDRGVYCGYEHIRERNRKFSVGRLRLLDELTGTLISFMDDDIVLAPSATRNLYDACATGGGVRVLEPDPARTGATPTTRSLDSRTTRRAASSTRIRWSAGCSASTTRPRPTSWTRGAALTDSGRRRSCPSCSRRWAATARSSRTA